MPLEKLDEPLKWVTTEVFDVTRINYITNIFYFDSEGSF